MIVSGGGGAVHVGGGDRLSTLISGRNLAEVSCAGAQLNGRDGHPNLLEVFQIACEVIDGV